MWAAVSLILIPLAVGVRITSIHVPAVVDVRNRAELHCLFDLGSSRLNSVKWYKDELEFFRFAPLNEPRVAVFPVTGVHVLQSASNSSVVILEPLEFASTGSYVCEISTEAPHFNLDRRNANMTVLGIPEYDPVIAGLEPVYHLGDVVNGNCTSAPSEPVADIVWLINGRQANAWLLEQHRPQINRNLASLTISLQFRVNSTHFSNRRRLNLTCVARVANIVKSSTVLALLPEPRGHYSAQPASQAFRIRSSVNWALSALGILAIR